MNDLITDCYATVIAQRGALLAPLVTSSKRSAS